MSTVDPADSVDVEPVTARDGGRASEASKAGGKALHVLQTFEGMGNLYGVRDLARRADLPRSTVHRLLAQLVESGFVMRVGSQYRLSLNFFSLGNRYVWGGARGMREVARPHLGALFLQTQYIVNLGVLDGADVVCLEKLQGPRAPGGVTVVGGRTPASLTALGKAMLAFSTPETIGAALARDLPRATPNSITGAQALVRQLQEIHEAGLAIDQEEASPGVVCVAAPVLINGRQTAAVSISAPANQIDLDRFSSLVQRTAQNLAVGLAVDRKYSITA